MHLIKKEPRVQIKITLGYLTFLYLIVASVFADLPLDSKVPIDGASGEEESKDQTLVSTGNVTAYTSVSGDPNTLVADQEMSVLLDFGAAGFVDLSTLTQTPTAETQQSLDSLGNLSGSSLLHDLVGPGPEMHTPIQGTDLSVVQGGYNKIKYIFS